MDNKHTYGWYVTHHFEPGGNVIDRLVNASINKTHLNNLQALGVIDQVPTVDNFVPLVQTYNDWWQSVDKDWSNYTKERGKPLETLHLILAEIIMDPTTDPEIIRRALQVRPEYAIACVYNPSCPRDIVVGLLNGCGSASDVTKNTNGGDIACFVLANKKAPSDIVDMALKKTKRAATQKNYMYHANVSHGTLVYLVNHGKTDAVKRDALYLMFEKGMLKFD